MHGDYLMETLMLMVYYVYNDCRQCFEALISREVSVYI